MLDASDIADGIVTALKANSALLTELEGNRDGVLAYKDAFPESVNLRDAILRTIPPGILVVWDGTRTSRSAPSTFWIHNFSLILRGREEGEYSTLVKAVWAALRYATIHASCNPLELPYSADREELMISADGAIIDYFRVRINVAEIGDN